MSKYLPLLLLVLSADAATMVAAALHLTDSTPTPTILSADKVEGLGPLDTDSPTSQPTIQPTLAPSRVPSELPVTTPTHLPSNLPYPQPTAQPSISTIQKSNSWSYIFKIMKYYFYIMVVQWLLFECFRWNAHVYESRRREGRARCKRSMYDPPPKRSRWPLGWIRPTLSVKKDHLLHLVGLDSFVMIRFIRLCWKLCLLPTVVCCCVLVPCYRAGNVANKDDNAMTIDDDKVRYDVQEFNSFTLLNVVEDETQSDDTDAEHYLWLPGVIAAYLFCAQTCFLVREEMRNYRDLRTAFFVRGDPRVDKQSQYTIMVENIPEQFRLNVTFRRLFDNLFPGCVHSSEVMQPLSNLRSAVKQAELCAEMLEQSIIARQNGRPTKVIRPWYARALFCLPQKSVVDAEKYWRSQLDKANKDITRLQREHFNKWSPLEEQARRKLRDIPMDWRDEQHSASANGPRMRAWSEGHLDLRDTNSSGSLTSTLLHNNSDASGTARRASASNFFSSTTPANALTSVREENLTTIMQPFTPFRLRSDPLRIMLVKEWTKEILDDTQVLNVSPTASTRVTEYSFLPGSENTARASTNFRSLRRNSAISFARSGQKMMARFFDQSKQVSPISSGSAGSTGFVTFNTLAAATMASQTTLCYKAFGLKTKHAPEKRDLLWQNVIVDSRQASTRKFVAQLILNIGALFFALLITTFAILSQRCINFYYERAENDDVSWFWLQLKSDNVDLICSYVPATLGLGVLLVVPWIFLFVAHTYESYKSKVDVEISIFRRYFNYYMAYIVITSITFSVSDLFEKVFEGNFDGTSALLSKMTAAVPKASGVFILVLILKIFFGITWELSRPWALLSKTIARFCSQKRMGARRYRKSMAADPCRYGWIFPQLVVVMAISMTYQVITPLIAPFGLVYFSLAFLVYKHQVLYVYVNDYESGGKFMPELLLRTIIIMGAGQILLFLFFVLKRCVSGAVLTLPLPLISFYFRSYLSRAYLPLLNDIPLDVAIYVDQKAERDHRMSGLSHEESFVNREFSIYYYQQPWLTQKPVRPKGLKMKLRAGQNSIVSARSSAVTNAVGLFRPTTNSFFGYHVTDLNETVDTILDGASEASPFQYRSVRPPSPTSNGQEHEENEESGVDQIAAQGNNISQLPLESPATIPNVGSPSLISAGGAGGTEAHEDYPIATYSFEDVDNGIAIFEGEDIVNGDNFLEEDDEEAAQADVKKLAYTLLHPDQQTKERPLSEDEFTDAWAHAFGAGDE